MSIKTEELTRLNAELAMIRTSISNIVTNGQSWQKGGRSGFSVQQVELPQLRKLETHILNQIRTWEAYID